MKKLLPVLFFFAGTLTITAQIYTAKPGATSISFFSEAPLENIEAVSKVVTIVMRPATNDIQARLSIQTFKFKNALMEEHFNENYLESEKYPDATFKGKINEKLDLTKEGETKVTITGIMDLHGVQKEVTMDGTVNKVGEELKLDSKFKMKVADYNIKVPSMYVKNIAEVVDVTFGAILEPYKKK